MNLALVFSRKNKWPEYYFSIWCSVKTWKIIATNHFLVITIFFTNMNIYFFSLCSDLFSIIAKKVNQIGNKVVCVVAHLVFVLLCTHYGPLLCFSTCFCRSKEKSEFYGHIFRLCYFFVTMFTNIKLRGKYQ